MNKISHQKLALIIIDGITKKNQYNQTKSNVTVSLTNLSLITHFNYLYYIICEGLRQSTNERYNKALTVKNSCRWELKLD